MRFGLSHQDIMCGRVLVLAAFVWRWLTSRQALRLALAVLLAGALAAGLLPQLGAPAHLSPSEAVRWQSEARSRWGGLLSVTEPVGLDHVYVSAGYRLTVAFLGLLLLVRLLALWVPRWGLPPTDSVVWRAGAVTTSGDADDRLAAALRREALRQVPIGERAGVASVLIADASPLRYTAGLTYLGVLLLLTAAVAQSHPGWMGAPIDLALGERQTLAPHGTVTAQLEQITLLAEPDGVVRRFEAELALSSGDLPVATVHLGPGQPAVGAGLHLYYLGRGPAVRVEASRPDGAALALSRLGDAASAEGALRVRFPTAEQEQLVLLGQIDRIVQLVNYSPSAVGRGYPVIRAQYREASSGRLLGELLLAEGGELRDDRAVVRLAPEYYVRVRAEREPDLPLAVIGAVTLLAGGLGGALWPPRRAWVVRHVSGDGARCKVVLPARDAGPGWAVHLCDALLGSEG